jgi:hypothetical protein
MSHFTVMVIGDCVDDILEPYDENKKVKPHIDQTKDEIHKDFMKCQGRIYAENKPKDDLDDFEKLTLSIDNVNSKWLDKWNGRKLDKNGNTLSTYNQDSKWDWYQVGGRWSGSLILKPDRIGDLGERSWTNRDVEVPSGRVDVAIKGDIDWDAMNGEARKDAEKSWDDLFNPNPETCWYNSKYIEKQQKSHLELYGTKEEYVKRRGIWTPYAYVTESGWFAPGDMGYWGMSSDDTEDRDAFDQQFKKFIEELSDDELITMVDCHI